MAKGVILVATLCFLVTFCASDESCPSGFMQHGTSCYLFSVLRLNWIQAMKLCTLYNAELAVVTAYEEEQFIENYLKSTWTHYNQTDGIWLGGTDLLVENEWIWAVSQDPITYSRWAPGEPNSLGAYGEDCLDFLPHKAFQWNDENCDLPLNFLCERSLFKDYVPPSVIG